MSPRVWSSVLCHGLRLSVFFTVNLQSLFSAVFNYGHHQTPYAQQCHYKKDCLGKKKPLQPWALQRDVFEVERFRNLVLRCETDKSHKKLDFFVPKCSWQPAWRFRLARLPCWGCRRACGYCCEYHQQNPCSSPVR